MRTDHYFDSCGKGKIHYCKWMPEGQPKAVLQILHGIAEHVERYDDFANYLTEEYLASSVLEGLVFDDVKTGNKKTITLVASVSYPMTDLYIPFKVTIDSSGKMSVRKDEDMGDYTPIVEDSTHQ